MCVVATVSWLENDVFLLVHNPSGGSGQPAYHIATRQAHPNAAPSFVFQKLNDPVELSAARHRITPF